MPARRTRPIAAAPLALALAGCLGVGAPLERVVDDGVDDDGGGAPPAPPPPPPPEPGPDDPHGAAGIEPPHGPFSGGLRAVVRGAGFTEETRVWIGGAPAEDVVVLGPTRVQVRVPAGEPGPADVTTQRGDDASTRRTAEGAFTYDPFFLEPAVGPTSGGVVTRVVARGTAFGEGTTAAIDGAPCAPLEVRSPEELTCTVPPGTPGAKPVTVTTSSAGATTVLDAFTYDDAPDGVAGGLSGSPLAGRLEVRAFDAYSGEPLVGATVVVGDDLASAWVETADASGRVVVEDPALDEPVTVTVAAVCHQPMTFVDVPVDRVNVYLDPVLVIGCADEVQLPGPPAGGGTSSRGTVRGEIFWDTVGEFQRGPFDVPAPGPNEKRVAYVLTAAPSQGTTFTLPSPSLAIPEDAPGGIGYAFEIEASAGNRVLYALAGLERIEGAARTFTAWSMGVLRGVWVSPGIVTEDVAIPMAFPLEHALEVDVAPPAPTERGPDRLLVATSLRLGTEGWLPLPSSRAPRLLPFEGTLPLLGQPLLDGALAGGSYVVSGRAGTGPDLLLPVSVVGGVATTIAGPVSLGTFVGVPSLASPTPGGLWDGERLEIEVGAGSSAIDVLVIDVAPPGDLLRWRIAAPGAARSIRLPDLRQLGHGLPFGALRVGIVAGRIDGLDYGALAYRDLRYQNMDAYALDAFDVLH